MFQKSSPISTISLNIRHDVGNPAQLETQPLLTHSFAWQSCMRSTRGELPPGKCGCKSRKNISFTSQQSIKHDKTSKFRLSESWPIIQGKPISTSNCEGQIRAQKIAWISSLRTWSTVVHRNQEQHRDRRNNQPAKTIARFIVKSHITLRRLVMRRLALNSTLPPSFSAPDREHA